MNREAWRFSERFIAAHTAYELAVSENRESSPCDWVDLNAPFAPLMVASLLRSGAAVVDFDQQWLMDRVGELPQSIKIDVVALVREVFEDQVGLGIRPRWVCYSIWNRSPSELDLRVAGDPFPLGFQISGKWCLAERISGGGFGVVYLGISSEDAEMVAIKAQRSVEGLAMQAAAKKLRREYLTLAQLSIPGVPRALEFLEILGIAVIVMEYIDAESMRSSALRSVSEILTILSKVGRIVDRIHRAGFLFGDLKPENILIRRDMSVCLVDFGCALRLEPCSNEFDGIAGTADYLNPMFVDQIPEGFDVAQDLWSLAMILYEQLAGRSIESQFAEHTTIEGNNWSKLERSFVLDWPITATPAIKMIWARAVSQGQHKVADAFLTAGDFSDACDQVLLRPGKLPGPAYRPEVYAFQLGQHVALMAILIGYFNEGRPPGWRTSASEVRNYRKILSKFRVSFCQIYIAGKNLGFEVPECPLSESILSISFNDNIAQMNQDLEISEAEHTALTSWFKAVEDNAAKHFQLASPQWLLSLYFIAWYAYRFASSPEGIQLWQEQLLSSQIPSSVYQRFLCYMSQWPDVPWEKRVDEIDNWVYLMRRFLLWEYPEMSNRDLWQLN